MVATGHVSPTAATEVFFEERGNSKVQNASEGEFKRGEIQNRHHYTRTPLREVKRAGFVHGREKSFQPCKARPEHLRLRLVAAESLVGAGFTTLGRNKLLISTGFRPHHPEEQLNIIEETAGRLARVIRCDRMRILSSTITLECRGVPSLLLTGAVDNPLYIGHLLQWGAA